MQRIKAINLIGKRSYCTAKNPGRYFAKKIDLINTEKLIRIPSASGKHTASLIFLHGHNDKGNTVEAYFNVKLRDTPEVPLSLYA